MGAYYSQELNTTYTISKGEEGLFLHRRRFPDRALSPRTADGFSAGNWRISFSRSAAGVNGFTLTSGRVRNLRFVRM